MVKANTDSETASTYLPTPGMAASKLWVDSTAPVAPEFQTPLTTMASPVMVQTMMVSMKVPIMPTSPEKTGSRVAPAAWAMPAVPRPASLEKMPRATPMRMAISTVEPRKPPVAAVGLKACSKISANAAGMRSKYTPST